MKAYLILEDGSVFEGESIGAEGEAIGEIVFTTESSGYMETISDPANFGRIVLQTFPIIGNYGRVQSDALNTPCLSGYVVRELCEFGSNFRKDGELSTYLKDNNIVSIAGIDTRAVTRKIREKGTMNAMISPSKAKLEQKLEKLKAYKITGAIEACSTKNTVVHNKDGEVNIVAWDMGSMINIVEVLTAKNAKITQMPAKSSIDEILAASPDGVIITAGGGDIDEYLPIIEGIKILAQKRIPMLGIGVGHELLARSFGAASVKLKHGHHGSNQPVKDLKRGSVVITTQNHSTAVAVKSIKSDIGEVSFAHANDGSCEGIDYKKFPAISIQFLPLKSGGGNDCEYHYDRFLDLIAKERK